MDRRKNENIAGWLDGQEKQKDGGMDIKNVWIERKMDGWIKQIDGWLEEKQKYEKNRCMVGWMDGYKHRGMVGWMDIKNRWIQKWKIGWI